MLQIRQNKGSDEFELPPCCLLWIQNEVIGQGDSLTLHTWRADTEIFRRTKHSTWAASFKMSKSVKKIVEESKQQGYTEMDLCDKSLSTIADIPGLSKCGKDSWKQKDTMFWLGIPAVCAFSFISLALKNCWLLYVSFSSYFVFCFFPFFQPNWGIWCGLLSAITD